MRRIKPLTLKSLKEEIRVIRREFRNLRNTTFAWVHRDLREIDVVIKRIEQIELVLPQLASDIKNTSSTKNEHSQSDARSEQSGHPDASDTHSPQKTSEYQDSKSADTIHSRIKQEIDKDYDDNFSKYLAKKLKNEALGKEVKDGNL